MPISVIWATLCEMRANAPSMLPSSAQHFIVVQQQGLPKRADESRTLGFSTKRSTLPVSSVTTTPYLEGSSTCTDTAPAVLYEAIPCEAYDL